MNVVPAVQWLTTRCTFTDVTAVWLVNLFVYF